MHLKTFAFAAAFTLTLSGAAFAQAPAGTGAPGTTGPTVQTTPGTTGNDPNVAISHGPTGASTVQTDSAAAGNAGHPSRRVPQGSGGGGNH
jgi:hypothetical protein